MKTLFLQAPSYDGGAESHYETRREVSLAAPYPKVWKILRRMLIGWGMTKRRLGEGEEISRFFAYQA